MFTCIICESWHVILYLILSVLNAFSAAILWLSACLISHPSACLFPFPPGKGFCLCCSQMLIVLSSPPFEYTFTCRFASPSLPPLHFCLSSSTVCQIKPASPYSWLVSLLSLWILFRFNHSPLFISISPCSPLLLYPQWLSVSVSVRERETSGNVCSLSASLKPINGGLSGCAVLCGCPQQNPVADNCAGSVWAGLNSGWKRCVCVFASACGGFNWLNVSGCQKEWWKGGVFVFVSIRLDTWSIWWSMSSWDRCKIDHTLSHLNCWNH